MLRTVAILTALLFGAGWVHADPAEVPRLIEQLKGKDTAERRQAADALGKLGPDAKDAVNALADAVKDKDPYVKRFAARSLGQIKADGKETMQALTRALVPPAVVKKSGLDGK